MRCGSFILVVILSFVLAPSRPRADDRVLISCRAPACVLLFKTNAGWEQKVRIKATAFDFDLLLSGKGENAVHHQSLLTQGDYEVTAWHKMPEADWVLSDIVVSQENEAFVARADDGGSKDHTTKVNDKDYNDAIVIVAPYLNGPDQAPGSVPSSN